MQREFKFNSSTHFLYQMSDIVFPPIGHLFSFDLVPTSNLNAIPLGILYHYITVRLKESETLCSNVRTTKDLTLICVMRSFALTLLHVHALQFAARY